MYAKEGWKGWGDFLGTGRIANQNAKFKSFVITRKFAQSLKLKGTKEWKAYCKSGEMPDDIPSNPNKEYKKEWVSWGDWLGTGRIGNVVMSRGYLEYEEAEKQAHILVKKLGIETPKDWIAKKKAGMIPDNLPTFPWTTYKPNRSKRKK